MSRKWINQRNGIRWLLQGVAANLLRMSRCKVLLEHEAWNVKAAAENIMNVLEEWKSNGAASKSAFYAKKRR